MLMLTLLALNFFLSGVVSSTPSFGSYFANWAIYHQGNFAYDATDLSPLASKLQEINYAFFYFCPPPGTNPLPYWAQPPYGSCSDSTAFQLMSVEPKDDSMLQTITGFKSSNPNLRVMLSVGGWNFPSSYFSAMASTASTRAVFIASALSWVQKYGADGIDVDWEYPCSQARSDPVEISCSDFQTVADAGGSCPEDTTNVVLLFKELSAAFSPAGKVVSVASQAGKPQELEMAVASLYPYIDFFHVMTYDYQVSDIPAGSMTFSPNAPLYTPAAAGTTQMSINYTIGNYLSVGVPPSKISVGIPLYSHSYFSPNLNSTSWKSWGGATYVQGLCCGPFKSTFGGKPGAGAQECGTLMYSELMAALGDAANSSTYFDEETQSNIAYFSSDGADGTTPAGTWVTYNDPRSAVAITKWAKSLGLGGVFIFDSSMDTISGGQFTYEISNAIANELAAP